MRKSWKKASLQLSINAIVILILAITILGIGLGFIRNQWTSMEDRLGQISQEIQEQIVQKIKDSGEILAFDRTEIEVQKGKAQRFFFGVKNTHGEARMYGFQVVCIQSQKAASSTSCDGDIYGGMDVSVGNAWFNMFQQSVISSGEIKVMPINLQIPNADPDTYEMQVRVHVGDDDGSVSDADEIIARKTFYIIVR